MCSETLSQIIREIEQKSVIQTNNVPLELLIYEGQDYQWNSKSDGDKSDKFAICRPIR